MSVGGCSDIAYIATNPFKRLVMHKSGATNEWAIMNKNQVQKGLTQDALKKVNLRQSKEHFRRELGQQLSLVENRKQAEKMEKMEDAHKIEKVRASPPDLPHPPNRPPSPSSSSTLTLLGSRT